MKKLLSLSLFFTVLGLLFMTQAYAHKEALQIAQAKNITYNNIAYKPEADNIVIERAGLELGVTVQRNPISQHGKTFVGKIGTTSVVPPALTRQATDANCTKPDISFTGLDGVGYTRAGCNSTLGGVGYSKEYTGDIYDCSDNGGTWSPIQNGVFSSMLSTELSIGGGCKINNIFGKLYQRDSSNGAGGGVGLSYSCTNTAITGTSNFAGADNSNCACPTGRHVPTDDEWLVAEHYYTKQVHGTDYSYDKLGWTRTPSDPSIGRNGDTNGLTQVFGLPLAGYCSDSRCNYRGYDANYRSASEYDSTYAFGRYISRDVTDFYRGYYNKYYYFSVRCLKD